MENKMEELARLAGLELEEEFRMDNYSTKYKITKNGFMYWSDDYQLWNYTCGIEELFLGKRQIVKISKQILNEKEKEYLSNVIKPFRDRIISIRKYRYNQDEYIGMYVKYYAETDDSEMITLPVFKEETMYKGMKLNKEYTLEELEL